MAFLSMAGQVMTTFRGLSKVTATNFGTMNGQMMAPNYNWRMTSEVVMKNPMRFCQLTIAAPEDGPEPPWAWAQACGGRGRGPCGCT